MGKLKSNLERIDKNYVANKILTASELNRDFGQVSLVTAALMSVLEEYYQNKNENATVGYGNSEEDFQDVINKAFQGFWEKADSDTKYSRLNFDNYNSVFLESVDEETNSSIKVEKNKITLDTADLRLTSKTNSIYFESEITSLMAEKNLSFIASNGKISFLTKDLLLNIDNLKFGNEKFNIEDTNGNQFLIFKINEETGQEEKTINFCPFNKKLLVAEDENSLHNVNGFFSVNNALRSSEYFFKNGGKLYDADIADDKRIYLDLGTTSTPRSLYISNLDVLKVKSDDDIIFSSNKDVKFKSDSNVDLIGLDVSRLYGKGITLSTVGNAKISTDVTFLVNKKYYLNARFGKSIGDDTSTIATPARCKVYSSKDTVSTDTSWVDGKTYYIDHDATKVATPASLRLYEATGSSRNLKLQLDYSKGFTLGRTQYTAADGDDEVKEIIKYDLEKYRLIIGYNDYTVNSSGEINNVNPNNNCIEYIEVNNGVQLVIGQYNPANNSIDNRPNRLSFDYKKNEVTSDGLPLKSSTTIYPTFPEKKAGNVTTQFGDFTISLGKTSRPFNGVYSSDFHYSNPAKTGNTELKLDYNGIGTVIYNYETGNATTKYILINAKDGIITSNQFKIEKSDDSYFWSSGQLFTPSKGIPWGTSFDGLYGTRMYSNGLAMRPKITQSGVYSDAGWIKFDYSDSTSGNDGFMEIAVGDDGEEPIYVRQYSYEEETKIKNEIALLDKNGITQLNEFQSKYHYFGMYRNSGGTKNCCFISNTNIATMANFPKNPTEMADNGYYYLEGYLSFCVEENNSTPSNAITGNLTFPICFRICAKDYNSNADIRDYSKWKNKCVYDFGGIVGYSSSNAKIVTWLAWDSSNQQWCIIFKILNDSNESRWEYMTDVISADPAPVLALRLSK